MWQAILFFDCSYIVQELIRAAGDKGSARTFQLYFRLDSRFQDMET
jgi:hypothetical protein